MSGRGLDPLAPWIRPGYKYVITFASNNNCLHAMSRILIDLKFDLIGTLEWQFFYVQNSFSKRTKKLP